MSKEYLRGVIPISLALLMGLRITTESLAQTSDRSYDYCRLGPNPTPIDLLFAGAPVTYTTLLRGDLEAIRAQQVSAGNIIRGDPSESYKVVLVPSGYDNEAYLTSRMGYLTNLVNGVFAGLNVSFSYLNKSMPIGIKQSGNFVALGSTDEAETVFQKIKAIYDVDNILVVFRSPLNWGRGGTYPIASGDGLNSATTIIHEQLHVFGLSDAYPKYYGGSLAGNTEIFTSIESLHPTTRNLLLTIKVPYVDSGNNCAGLPVYTFYGGSNIMARKLRDMELEEILDRGESILNPLQREFVKHFTRRPRGN